MHKIKILLYFLSQFQHTLTLNNELFLKKRKKNGFTLICILRYRRPTRAPFAALVVYPWFTIYICAQMYIEGHNAINLLSRNRSLTVREPKKQKKGNGNFLQESSRKSALPSDFLQSVFTVAINCI